MGLDLSSGKDFTFFCSRLPLLGDEDKFSFGLETRNGRIQSVSVLSKSQTIPMVSKPVYRQMEFPFE